MVFENDFLRLLDYVSEINRIIVPYELEIFFNLFFMFLKIFQKQLLFPINICICIIIFKTILRKQVKIIKICYQKIFFYVFKSGFLFFGSQKYFSGKSFLKSTFKYIHINYFQIL